MYRMNRVRKQWLIALFFYFGFLPLVSAGIIAYLFLIQQLSTPVSAILMSGVIAAFLLGYALYHFAYKRRGVKLLLVYSVMYLAQCLLAMFGRGMSVWGLTIGGLLAFCWCFTSYRLLKFNRLHPS